MSSWTRAILWGDPRDGLKCVGCEVTQVCADTKRMVRCAGHRAGGDDRGCQRGDGRIGRWRRGRRERGGEGEGEGGVRRGARACPRGKAFLVDGVAGMRRGVFWTRATWAAWVKVKALVVGRVVDVGAVMGIGFVCLVGRVICGMCSMPGRVGYSGVVLSIFNDDEVWMLMRRTAARMLSEFWSPRAVYMYRVVASLHVDK